MLMSITGIVCAVGLTNVYLAVPVLLVGTVFYKFRDFYMPASRSVKRLESVGKREYDRSVRPGLIITLRLARSPVYAHLGASMQGLTTIRAYGAQRIVSEEFDKYQVRERRPPYPFRSRLIPTRCAGFTFRRVVFVHLFERSARPLVGFSLYGLHNDRGIRRLISRRR